MLCFSAQEVLLSLHGPAEVDRQEEVVGPLLAAACRQSGLPRTLFFHNQEHQGQETSGNR